MFISLALALKALATEGLGEILISRPRKFQRLKGLAALNRGVEVEVGIAPVPPPELFPRAAGLYRHGRTEMI
jgi:hypothetical protein